MQNKTENPPAVTTRIILIILLMVVPMNIVSLVSVNRSLSKMRENTLNIAQDMAEMNMADVSRRMDNTVSMMIHLETEDATCLKMLSQPEEEYEYNNAKLRCYNALRQMEDVVSGADGYWFYMKTRKDYMVCNATRTQNREKWVDTIVQQQLLKTSGRGGWHVVATDEGDCLFLLIDSPNYAYGAWILLDSMTAQLEENLRGIHARVYYANQEAEENADICFSYKGITQNVEIDVNAMDWQSAKYEWILLGIAVLSILCIPLLYFFLHIILVKPLRQINYAHDAIKNGNENYRLPVYAGSNEFQEANRSFNQMADNLKKLKIEAYEKELDRQEMELKALQLQIRPHFLLNTFNYLFTLTQIQDLNGLQEGIIYISDYFRYIIRSNELEMISKEIHLLEGYAKLLSRRYDGRVECYIEFDPELYMVRIPPLLIMTFLENAIQHGMVSEGTLTIGVNGEYKNEEVIIMVVDDGIGMAESELQYLNELFTGKIEPSDKNSHIGLYNCLRRMKYYMGDSSSIEVARQDGLTTFCVRFPYKLEDLDEAVDSQ